VRFLVIETSPLESTGDSLVNHAVCAYPRYTSVSQMRLFIALTDKSWFAQHAAVSHLDEVNFWRPSGTTSFKALDPGELLLFKLHSPDNFIAGGGFFTRFLNLPVSLAWDTFGEENGVRSLPEMRARISHYRESSIATGEDPAIGCIMLAEPFFWPQEMWIPSGTYLKPGTQVGVGHDSEQGVGHELWKAVIERIVAMRPVPIEPDTATAVAIQSNGFGKPQLILPRLGQGLFRILVTDVYDRRCAITGERTLPVLDAAHIKPYSVAHRHEVSNGLLMRSDLHRLFDNGYLTVDPVDRRVVVSDRIKAEFDNGREYYRLHGQQIREPVEPMFRAGTENLEFHAYNVFR
jgi:putative restriction endonuclease